MYTKITAAPYGDSTSRWLDNSVSNEEHHSLKCISSSQLKFLESGKSMFNFHEKYIAKTIKQSFSDEFRIGTIAHLAVLEPEKFEKTVIVCDLDQRTSEFKELRDSLAKKIDPSSVNPTLLEANQKLVTLKEELEVSDTKEQQKVIKGKIKTLEKDIKSLAEEYTPRIKITKNGGFLGHNDEEIFLVKSEEMQMYRTFQKRCQDHKWLSALIPICTIEQSGVAMDPETGLWMSIRGDARGQSFFLDPKTMADDITPDSIKKYCGSFGLALQAAHYLDVANLIEPDIYKKFAFIMLSKKQPYEIALIQLDEASMQYGFKKRRQLLNKIAQCEYHGVWPQADYNEGQHAMVISLPPWSMKLDG